MSFLIGLLGAELFEGVAALFVILFALQFVPEIIIKILFILFYIITISTCAVSFKCFLEENKGLKKKLLFILSLVNLLGAVVMYNRANIKYEIDVFKISKADVFLDIQTDKARTDESIMCVKVLYDGDDSWEQVWPTTLSTVSISEPRDVPLLDKRSKDKFSLLVITFDGGWHTVNFDKKYIYPNNEKKIRLQYTGEKLVLDNEAVLTSDDYFCDDPNAKIKREFKSKQRYNAYEVTSWVYY